MNYKMPGTKIVQTLPAFLKLHRIKKDDNTSQKVSTHTRIGGKDENGEVIYGGNYHIPEEALPMFWKLYVKWVFDLGHKEYLTETQDIENGGPLLVDIDMRFAEEIIERQIKLNLILLILKIECKNRKFLDRDSKKMISIFKYKNRLWFY